MCKYCAEGSGNDTHIVCALCDKSYLWMVLAAVVEDSKRLMLCPSCYYIIKGEGATQ